jgi:isopenicillin N synthase-like dioxygenase
MTQSSHPAIPVIDVLNCGGFKGKEFIRQIGTALANYGFASLLNHEFPLPQIERLYEVAYQVFDLPSGVKEQYSGKLNKYEFGYASLGFETAQGGQRPDLKEAWSIQRRGSKNLFPIEIAAFQGECEKTFAYFEFLSLRIAVALGRYLGIEEEDMLAMMFEGTSILRLLNYPTIPMTSGVLGMRAAPHTDINLITILPNSKVGGLEVRHGSEWLPIPDVRNTLIVNGGDMLARLSEGMMKSAEHRVVNETSRRLSAVFFAHPHSQAVLAVDGENKLTAGAFLEQRLAEIIN